MATYRERALADALTGLRVASEFADNARARLDDPSAVTAALARAEAARGAGRNMDALAEIRAATEAVGAGVDVPADVVEGMRRSEALLRALGETGRSAPAPRGR